MDSIEFVSKVYSGGIKLNEAAAALYGKVFANNRFDPKLVEICKSLDGAIEAGNPYYKCNVCLFPKKYVDYVVFDDSGNGLEDVRIDLEGYLIDQLTSIANGNTDDKLSAITTLLNTYKQDPLLKGFNSSTPWR